jgi:two-component system sensor histidine kinase BarA
VIALAVLVFYLITHYLVLSPVRALKETAELVREGNLAIRSDITTGDEFQELSETFNGMLTELQRTQEQLRAINAALDLKLGQLAEANTALYESAKLKGEFLANVSHELRTPLNSIIGFAELLNDIASAEAQAGDDSTRLAKRLRYTGNILVSGKNLLDMINGLLEMAKIEAGKIELRIEPVVLRDACEGLVGLIHPLADRKGIELNLDIEPDLPIIETDPKRFQQIVFNFLSNAVKFTPSKEAAGKAGQVTLRAERLASRGVGGAPAQERVRVSVIDTGPGIAPDDQPRIFEKFHQLDGSHTREHPGTGLGLSICKELAAVLQGELQLVSDLGRGSMFSVILPVKMDRDRAAEIKLESAFRGSLAPKPATV